VQFSIAANVVESQPTVGSDNCMERVYMWDEANYDAITAYLECIDWHEMLACNLTVDELWSAFTDVLQQAIDLYVPVRFVNKKCSTTGRRKPHVNYPRNIKQEIARKRCLWRQHKLNPSDSVIYNNYRAAHKACNQLIRDFEVKRERDVIDANNLGKFYSFVNKKLSCKSGVGTLLDSDKNTVTDDSGKAELLNEFFASVGMADNGKPLTIDREVPDNVGIETVEFTPEAVFRAINKVKLKSAPGPDGFPPQLLKKIGRSLAYIHFLKCHKHGEAQ